MHMATILIAVCAGLAIEDCLIALVAGRELIPFLTFVDVDNGVGELALFSIASGSVFSCTLS